MMTDSMSVVALGSSSLPVREKWAEEEQAIEQTIKITRTRKSKFPSMNWLVVIGMFFIISTSNAKTYTRTCFICNKKGECKRMKDCETGCKNSTQLVCFACRDGGGRWTNSRCWECCLINGHCKERFNSGDDSVGEKVSKLVEKANYYDEITDNTGPGAVLNVKPMFDETITYQLKYEEKKWKRTEMSAFKAGDIVLMNDSKNKDLEPQLVFVNSEEDEKGNIWIIPKEGRTRQVPSKWLVPITTRERRRMWRHAVSYEKNKAKPKDEEIKPPELKRRNTIQLLRSTSPIFDEDGNNVVVDSSGVKWVQNTHGEWVRDMSSTKEHFRRRRFLAARSRRRKLMQRVERMKFLASRRRRRRLLMEARENSTRN